MNTKIKIAAIMVLTLILGIIIGAMANQAFMHNRIRRTFAMANPVSFPRRIMDVIQPTPEQEQELKKILDRHSQRLFSSRQKFMEESREVWEALLKEMESILTPEQKERLDSQGRLRRLRPDFKKRSWRPGEGRKPIKRGEKRIPFPD